MVATRQEISEPTPRLLLCGYYGEHNLGDDALLEVLLSQLPGSYQATVTAHDGALVRERFGVDTVARRSLPLVLKAQDIPSLLERCPDERLHQSLLEQAVDLLLLLFLVLLVLIPIIIIIILLSLLLLLLILISLLLLIIILILLNIILRLRLLIILLLPLIIILLLSIIIGIISFLLLLLLLLVFFAV